MSSIIDIHTNYDAAFKEALVLYKNKTFGFLGLDMASIEEPLDTEHTEVKVKKTYAELAFGLSDKTGFHPEWEADISIDDMMRFADYNINLSRKYKIPFLTVIFTNKKQTVTKYINKSLSFIPIIINLGERNGDALLSKIKAKIEKGEKLDDILELLYLPLYKSSTKSVVQLLKEVIAIVPKVTDDIHEQQKMILLSALISNKFISESEIEELWEAITMFVEEIKILKVTRDKALEQGIQEGIERGIEEGKTEIAINMLNEGSDMVFIQKVTGLDLATIKGLHAKLT